MTMRKFLQMYSTISIERVIVLSARESNYDRNEYIVYIKI